MLVEMKPRVETPAGLAHSSLKGLRGTDACEVATALVFEIAPASGAAVGNQSIDLPEVVAGYVVRHPLKTMNPYWAPLPAMYPAPSRLALSSKHFYRN